MSRPNARALLLALIAAIALVASTAHAADDDAYTTDGAGRRMRVSFDEGHRLFVGAAYGVFADGADPVSARRFDLSAGVSIAHRVDFDGEGIRWKLWHDLARVTAGFGAPGSTVNGELYSLRFLRWSEDGAIVLPTTPPHRVGFPFGLGFEIGLGSADVTTDGGLRGEIGVARGAFSIDFLRSRSHDRFVTLGVGPRYSLRLDLPAKAPIDHVVVPFTQPELATRFRFANGHQTITARAGGGYAWTSLTAAGAQARADFAHEAVLVAVNDVPVSLRSSVAWRYDDPPLPGRGPNELRADVGFVFGVPLPNAPR